LKGTNHVKPPKPPKPKHPRLVKKLEALYVEYDKAVAENDFVEAMLLSEKIWAIEDKVHGKEVITGGFYGVTKGGKLVPIELPM
jgi:hypothetical protein